MEKPNYFERIRDKAIGHWDKLDKDPELAGPWHQLFKQVQNPRHVISELLQNADDAEATEAYVELRDGEFIFSHNGTDFNEEQFASLCRFGYSNKRVLHTIGFRGVGFKSTFSLGDEVLVHSPTIFVRFKRKRFTEPTWLGDGMLPAALTEVRIKIKNPQRAEALQKNISEWRDSATSLLFFRHIRCLIIEDKEIRWIPQDPGPAPGSEWVALSTAPSKKYLKIRSSEEPFPEDSIIEIRQERMVFSDEEMDLPPCSLDLIMGMEGSLFVVLPSGIKTKLPFACNAPFLQDPARAGIKEPAISPTNRWLLERAGRLAASTFLSWLKREDLSLEDRCEAYELLSAVNRTDNTIEGKCGQLVEEALGSSIKGQAVLLTVDGVLENRSPCRSIPKELHEVWTPVQLKALFAKDAPGILSRYIKESSQRKLAHWNLIEKVEKHQVLTVLSSTKPPRPESWLRLSLLWDYLCPELTRNYYRSQYKRVHIFPVHGLDALYAAPDITRIGDKKEVGSEEDWPFLEKYVHVLDRDWMSFLAHQVEIAERSEDPKTGESAISSLSVLEEFGLEKPTAADDLIEKVSAKLFSGPDVSLDDHIRIAQIAAKLDARLQHSFHYVTNDDSSRSIEEHILMDQQGDLDLFLDPEWHAAHTLHERYFRDFNSCTQNEWREWLSSGKSGLLGFPRMKKTETECWDNHQPAYLFPGRGGTRKPNLYYDSNKYVLEDWDYEETHWKQWRNKAHEDRTFWWKILRKIMDQPLEYWAQSLEAVGWQIGTKGRGAGNRSRVTWGMYPAWVISLREVHCIKDQWGQYRQPAEVMRRTPKTEVFLEAEPFVVAEYDTDALKPLLVALGLRDTPAGPESILGRLEALSETLEPPLKELMRWYVRLDDLAQRSSTEELEKLKHSFATKNLILADGPCWMTSSEVFSGPSDDDVPGSLPIHPAFRHLALWQRIGVPDRPSAESAIGWLKSLRSNQKLEPPELKRVISIASRFPERVWNESGHWPSVEGAWTPVGDLEYGARKTSASLLGVLFASIRQKTADLKFLGESDLAKQPFFSLRDLSSAVEERISGCRRQGTPPSRCCWLNKLGSELARVVLETNEETSRVSSLGNRLAGTQWRMGESVEATPHIDGIPVGEPRRLDILWDGSVLYTPELNAVKLAKPIAEELGKAFQRNEIKDAIRFCYDRSDEFIKDYFRENFLIAESQALQAGRNDGDNAAISATAGKLPDQEIRTDGLDTPPSENEKAVEIRLSGILADIPEDGTAQALGTEGEGASKERKAARQDREPLIARFSLAEGFAKTGDGLFVRPDGQRIEKVKEAIFPWQRFNASGELTKNYWIQDRCIRKKPIEIEAEALANLKSEKERCSLILCDDDGEPVELPGECLLDMIDRGEITVYVSSYSLVRTDERTE